MVSNTPRYPDLSAIADWLLTDLAAFIGSSCPTRRYRAAGQSAWDFASGCNGVGSSFVPGQLVLWPVNGTAGIPGGGGQTVDRGEWTVRTWQFIAELVRCVPTIQGTMEPSQADLDDSGAMLLQDMQLLERWPGSLGFNSKLRPELYALNVMSVAPGTQTVVGPLGGLVGVRSSFLIGTS